jgi:acetyltransferase-like isoleucine patch superfamily enzyme
MVAAVRERLHRQAQIVGLRRAGLAVAWSVELSLSPASSLTFGSGCRVGRLSILDVTSYAGNAKLTLGDQVVLGAFCNVRAADTEISIGNRVLIAQHVSLIGTNHVTGGGGSDWADVEPERQGIAIGDNCWLGTHAIILPGVQLGPGCVVGAGAVVTRSAAAGTRLVGNPARAIRR